MSVISWQENWWSFDVLSNSEIKVKTFWNIFFKQKVNCFQFKSKWVRCSNLSEHKGLRLGSSILALSNLWLRINVGIQKQTKPNHFLQYLKIFKSKF